MLEEDVQRLQDDIVQLEKELEKAYASNEATVLSLRHRYECCIQALGDDLLANVDKRTPRYGIISQLRVEGHISYDEYKTLARANELRNKIIHHLNLEVVDELRTWTKWMDTRWDLPV